MALDLGFGRFLLLFPETVTLSRPASLLAGPAASVTVERVQGQASRLETADEPSGGALDGEPRTFHLWASECPTLAPSSDFTITTADGLVWVIKEVDRLAHGARYRCATRRANR